MIDILFYNKRMSDIVIVDFFNVFSDFREVKYKKESIDFHTIKYKTIRKDICEFFGMFFDKYIKAVNLPICSTFLFVMKKLKDMDDILLDLLQNYKSLDVQFVVLPDKYSDKIVDKNKDDFLCQYLFYTLQSKSKKTHLVTNDRYRDTSKYMALFTFQINVLVYVSHTGRVLPHILTPHKLNTRPQCRNTAIPKKHLAQFL